MSDTKRSKKTKKEVIVVGGHFYDPVTFEEIKPTNDTMLKFEIDMTQEKITQMLPDLRAHWSKINTTEEDISTSFDFKSVPSSRAQDVPSTSSGSDVPHFKIYFEQKKKGGNKKN